MVLKCIVLALFFTIGLNTNVTEGPLLANYKSKIKKQVKQLVDSDHNKTQLTNLNLEFNNLEGYRVLAPDSELLVGYLFIKEVKACSLNGCTAKSVKVEDLSSEYYDISVLTDTDKRIISIKVLDYFSDYGYQITSKKYLRKYIDNQLCDFKMDQDIVDGVSGATISYNALITSLGEFCDLVE